MAREFSETIYLPPEILEAFGCLYRGVDKTSISEGELFSFDTRISLIADFKCGKDRRIRQRLEQTIMDLYCRSKDQKFKNILPSVHGPIGMDTNNPLDHYPTGW